MAASIPPRMSDERMVAATGKGHDEWFALLDEAGAVDLPHSGIAAHLQEEHGVPGWWAQSVTVAYEQARGLRARHEHADGFTAGKSKTIRAPIAAVRKALAEDAERAAWLDEPAALTVTSTAARAVNGRWGADSRIAVWLTDKGDRTLVAVQHSKLPDAEAVEEAKAAWGRRLEALAAHVAHLAP